MGKVIHHTQKVLRARPVEVEGILHMSKESITGVTMGIVCAVDRLDCLL